jgi:fructose-specific component phosphotransferase system IIB-like protein
LIDRAVAIFRATADADTTVIRGWCLEAYRELYRRMVAIGDFAGALRAVQSLLKYADSHASPEPDEPPPPGPEEAPAKPKRLTRKPSVAR